MAIKVRSIRLDTKLADEAARTLGAKPRAEAVDTALREVVALQRFKKLMKKYARELIFEGHSRPKRRRRDQRVAQGVSPG
jgi:Arc/MetJ family transcription regulator